MDDPQGGRPPTAYTGTIDADRERSIRTLTHIIYGLYALHWFTGGVSGLVAIILDYLKRGDAAGTPYADHFRWQIRTFWFGVAGYIIGGVLVFAIVGFPILAAVSIWMLYRIVKGWLYLYETKPLDPSAWF